eukprot:768431-Hanusia_phi.AAC.6
MNDLVKDATGVDFYVRFPPSWLRVLVSLPSSCILFLDLRVHQSLRGDLEKARQEAKKLNIPDTGEPKKKRCITVVRGRMMKRTIIMNDDGDDDRYDGDEDDWESGDDEVDDNDGDRDDIDDRDHDDDDDDDDN